jgi:hypothetical protein
VETLYTQDYATCLATVRAKWAPTEDIELHDFEFRRIDADPDNLPVVKQFPALLITMGRMTSSQAKTQLYENWYELEIACTYFLRAVDEHELGIILARHVEATLGFFEEHARLGFGRDFTISNVSFLPSSNVIPGGGNNLVKGLQVGFTARFLQSGI